MFLLRCTSGLPSSLVFDLVGSPGLEGGNLPMTLVVLYLSWNWVNPAVLVVGQYQALLWSQCVEE